MKLSNRSGDDVGPGVKLAGREPAIFRVVRRSLRLIIIHASGNSQQLGQKKKIKKSCKPQASSNRQASSFKHQAELQAQRTSYKQQASRKHSPKPQARASRTLEKVSETSDRGL